MENRNLKKIYFIVLSSLFSAFIIVGSLLKVTFIPPVPFTLQTLFVNLAALLLPPSYAALSVGSYILLGLIGLPVFTSGGGIASFLTPTFGFIIGFFIASIVMSILIKYKKEPSFLWYFLSTLIGMIIIYIIGFSYFYYIFNAIMGKNKPFMMLIKSVILIFIPADIIKAILAASLAKVLRKNIKLF